LEHLHSVGMRNPCIYFLEIITVIDYNFIFISLFLMQLGFQINLQKGFAN
jgi:hypothetical protein